MSNDTKLMFFLVLTAFVIGLVLFKAGAIHNNAVPTELVDQDWSRTEWDRSGSSGINWV